MHTNYDVERILKQLVDNAELTLDDIISKLDIGRTRCHKILENMEKEQLLSRRTIIDKKGIKKPYSLTEKGLQAAVNMNLKETKENAIRVAKGLASLRAIDNLVSKDIKNLSNSETNTFWELNKFRHDADKIRGLLRLSEKRQADIMDAMIKLHATLIDLRVSSADSDDYMTVIKKSQVFTIPSKSLADVDWEKLSLRQELVIDDQEKMPVQSFYSEKDKAIVEMKSRKRLEDEMKRELSKKTS